MARARKLDQDLLRSVHVELERLRRVNAVLEARVGLLESDNASLQTQNEGLRTENARLCDQVRELTAKLKQDSSNSSKPPSSDPPEVRDQRPSRPPSGRKPGGQPGHQGTTRRLLPADSVIPCAPTTCAHCGGALLAPTPDGRAPWIHQVVEMPPLKPEVTHYERQRCCCADCGKVTWGDLPAGVPERGVGPVLQAFCALLTGRHRLARRQGQELLEDLFGWSPALGTLMALEGATAAALQGPVEAVARAVAAQTVANADETGWRQGKKRPTLWAIVTVQAILFGIGDRSRETLHRLLPPNDWQHLVSDRYAVYEGIPVCRRGLCWSHLTRNFAGLTEREGVAGTIAHWAEDEIKKLFAHWHRFKARELGRAELQEEMVPVQDAFRALLNMGAEGECAKTAGFCTHLLERWEALWTFTRVDGVEPTNNAAERALRAAVLWRKGSFGHRSDAGKHFVERMLTVVATLRLQRRPILPFLTDACRAAITGEPPPEILPAAAPT